MNLFSGRLQRHKPRVAGRGKREGSWDSDIFASFLLFVLWATDDEADSSYRKTLISVVQQRTQNKARNAVDGHTTANC